MDKNHAKPAFLVNRRYFFGTSNRYPQLCTKNVGKSVDNYLAKELNHWFWSEMIPCFEKAHNKKTDLTITLKQYIHINNVYRIHLCPNAVIMDWKYHHPGLSLKTGDINYMICSMGNTPTSAMNKCCVPVMPNQNGEGKWSHQPMLHNIRQRKTCQAKTETRTWISSSWSKLNGPRLSIA